jgi:hypothetical protein
MLVPMKDATHTEKAAIKAGDVVNFDRLGTCEVVVVRGVGTVDVKCLKDGNFYRVTGLAILMPNEVLQ